METNTAWTCPAMYFSSVACLLISLVGCGGGSTRRLDGCLLNCSFTVLCLILTRDVFPLETVGWTNN